jgi:hypothetical protein
MECWLCGTFCSQVNYYGDTAFVFFFSVWVFPLKVNGEVREETAFLTT